MISRIAAASGQDVSRETFARLEAYVALLIAEASEQNLISQTTVEGLWERHIVDAAQLLRLAPLKASWCDVGSGAGLPGLVLAILGAGPITLVEPRRLRAEFLERVTAALTLKQVTVAHSSIASVCAKFDVVAARALAPLPKLFAMAEHVTHNGTVWLLPKGRSVQSELDEALGTWQGGFEQVPSLTSDEGVIVVAHHVRRRGSR